MILRVTDEGTLELTELALIVDEFASYWEKDSTAALALFSVCHFMYHFDSHFTDIEDEKLRLKEVRSFVKNGKEVTLTRTTHKIMAIYKELYSLELSSAYLTMKKNFKKLEDYAEQMQLAPEILEVSEEEKKEGFPDKMYTGIKVDYKEFAAVNSLIPKQQKELSEFRSRLSNEVKANIEAYGGGNLGAYE